MRQLIHDLAHSPIVRLGGVVALLVGLSFILWPTPVFNDIGDAFAIAGGVLVLVRFGHYAVQSLRRTDPDSADVLVIAVTGLAGSIGAIRLLRWIGLELGVINSHIVNVMFGTISALMVFSLFLLVGAPPMRYGRLKLSAKCAMMIAIGAGCILAMLVLAGHRRWW